MRIVVFCIGLAKPLNACPLLQWQDEFRTAGEFLVVVGSVMRADREWDLCHRGILHMWPIDGVIFIPLDILQSLEHQAPVDAILQKPTDFLVALAPQGYGFATDLVKVCCHFLCKLKTFTCLLSLQTMLHRHTTSDAWSEGCAAVILYSTLFEMFKDT